MHKIKIQKSIRKKRDEFLHGIVDQFQQSDENKTLFNCYDYVKIISNLRISSFTETLTEEEKELFQSNIIKWLSPIESFQTFSIFLSNNEINLNQ
jgi:hypothetical protein